MAPRFLLIRALARALAFIRFRSTADTNSSKVTFPSRFVSRSFLKALSSSAVRWMPFSVKHTASSPMSSRAFPSSSAASNFSSNFWATRKSPSSCSTTFCHAVSKSSFMESLDSPVSAVVTVFKGFEAKTLSRPRAIRSNLVGALTRLLASRRARFASTPWRNSEKLTIPSPLVSTASRKSSTLSRPRSAPSATKASPSSSREHFPSLFLSSCWKTNSTPLMDLSTSLTNSSHSSVWLFLRPTERSPTASENSSRVMRPSPFKSRSRVNLAISSSLSPETPSLRSITTSSSVSRHPLESSSNDSNISSTVRALSGSCRNPSTRRHATAEVWFVFFPAPPPPPSSARAAARCCRSRSGRAASSTTASRDSWR
mmetsp:Transcript_17221/g.39681  ORF Transcript_17221/g.39681 Transcript_17221/m.39681 type:complete len:371 (+) Transcript_17221:290-1402(+)